MARPSPNALSWLGLSLVVFVLDYWTKQLALEHLEYEQLVPVIGEWFHWRLTYNTGAAFSFLRDAGGWQRWFFTALAVGVSALLAFWLSRLPRSDWRQALPFSLIIGGALGNLVDRVRYGHVVDFIDVLYWPGKHWPAFNIADSAIVCGAIGLALFTVLTPHRVPAER